MACRLLHPFPDECASPVGKKGPGLEEGESTWKPLRRAVPRAEPAAHVTARLDSVPRAQGGVVSLPESRDPDSVVPLDDLPEHLLELILSAVSQEQDAGKWTDMRRSMLRVTGVNRQWRALGKHLLFQNNWLEGRTYVHPLQLFSLCPRHIPSPFGCPMVRCFLVRSKAPMTGVFSYVLYMGDQSVREDWKEPHDARPLLSAVRGPRGGDLHVFLGTNQQNALPLARVRSGYFGLSHWIMLDKSVRAFDADGGHPECYRAAGGPTRGAGGAAATPPALPSLVAEVTCTHRIHVLRPRTMRVSLPHESVLRCFSTQAEQSQEKASPSACHLVARAGSLPSLHLNLNAGDAVHPPEQTGRTGNVARVLSRLRSARRVGPAKGTEGSAPATATGLMAHNKPPHWNEQLRCWCLNFRGRVRMASVKNFQLMQEGDSRRETILQFGKVESNVYTLDFNPHVLSAVQAFSVALSTFGPRNPFKASSSSS